MKIGFRSDVLGLILNTAIVDRNGAMNESGINRARCHCGRRYADEHR